MFLSLLVLANCSTAQEEKSEKKKGNMADNVECQWEGDSEKVKRLNHKHNLRAKPTENSGRFFIADKKETFFMINPEGSDEEVGIWLSSPHFASSFAGMFDLHLRK